MQSRVDSAPKLTGHGKGRGMPGHTILTISALLLTAACTCPGATADGGTLVDRVESVLRREAPQLKIERLDESRIQVTADGGVVLLGLDNLRAQCTTFPEKCDATIARHVRVALSSLYEGSRKPTREQIRAAIKNEEWLAMIRSKLGEADGGTGDLLVTRPWIVQLSVVYVIDLPDSIVPLKRSAQREFHLEDSETDSLARRNLEAALPQLTLSAIGGYDGIFAIYEGEDYCTSQLLFPERFAPIAKKLGGHLIVAAPVRNALLVTGHQDSETLEAMRKLVTETAEAQPHPLSTALFDWSPKGFAPHR